MRTVKCFFVFLILMVAFVGCQKVKETKYDNGKLKSRAAVKIVNNQEVLDGPATIWYENGQTKMKIINKNGNLNGLATSWYENGKKKSECTYKDGMREGIETEWYESGQMQDKGTYKEDKKDGLVTMWNENGKKQAECTFKDGEKDGLFTMWNKDGQKVAEIHYRNGNKDGLETTWFENGQKLSECYYKDGKKDVSRPPSFWSRDGELLTASNAKQEITDQGETQVWTTKKFEKMFRYASREKIKQILGKPDYVTGTGSWCYNMSITDELSEVSYVGVMINFNEGEPNNFYYNHDTCG